MKKLMILFLAITVLIPLGTSMDAQAFQIVTREMMEKEIVVEKDFIKTADNFIILFDASATANQMVPGKNITKIQAAKNLLKERNALIPELGYKAGLYIYTNTRNLQEVYGMKTYSRDGFAAAIDQLPDQGKGPAMMNSALSGLRKVVAGLTGRTAVIMFTDGIFSHLRGAKDPLQIAQEIVKDNDVCFYLIGGATAAVEKELLEAVTKINSCSRAIPIAAFMDNPLYMSGALFTVKTTAYERLMPVTEVVGVKLENLLFDFGSSTIRGEYNDNLDMLGQYLQKNPEAYAVAVGFADSVGDEEYNLLLSERRASGVKDYLVNTFNIDMGRIVTQWYGELNPAADNATGEGRQLNRRVEIAVGEAE